MNLIICFFFSLSKNYSVLRVEKRTAVMCVILLFPFIQTAAYALPTLERLLYRPKNRPAIRVLILQPTRELAIQ